MHPKNKNRLRVTRCFTFDMAHALEGHDGPCRNIHGHTYRLAVTVSGAVLCEPGTPKDGMVIDFSELKRIVNEQIIHQFDHALVLSGHSPFSKLPSLTGHYPNILFTPWQPSCENLVLEFVRRIREQLPSGISLHSLRLDETPSSGAEWHASDNP